MADRDILARLRQPDGSLSTTGASEWVNGDYVSYHEYIDWPCTAQRVTLDGDFSAAELRQIADWIETHVILDVQRLARE